MDVVEYLKEKARMTNICKDNCFKCPLSSDNNGTRYTCIDLQYKCPEKAVEIVEKWAKENPVKTYKTVLFEKFPSTQINTYGYPKVCANLVFKSQYECDCNCKKCWNREYKEEE